MPFEALAEQDRVERDLVRRDALDAEPGEEFPRPVAVGLHEFVVRRGVVEHPARVAVEVREDPRDLLLVQRVEARALDEDAAELDVEALDVGLL